MALLGDAMEAVIAAVYRDAGFEAAKALVLRLWGRRITSVKEDARDAKSALQEWAQARGLQPPDYLETARSGPDHAPRFTIEARLSSGEAETATAGSKRQAEQAAAKALWRASKGSVFKVPFGRRFGFDEGLCPQTPQSIYGKMNRGCGVA